jgi:large conductance mechanosensitive channel
MSQNRASPQGGAARIVTDFVARLANMGNISCASLRVIANSASHRTRVSSCYGLSARRSPKAAPSAPIQHQFKENPVLKEFKEFAVRGNVVDMAVGIIIGAAFGKIVDSLVRDVIMPPIGLLLGRVDFSNLFVVMKQGAQAGPYLTVDAAQKAGAVTFNYGVFFNTVVSFVIVAFAVFLLIRVINQLKRQEEKKPAATPEEVMLLREIRDALRK